MKRLWSFSLLLLCWDVRAQHVVVSSDSVNVFWETIPNPVAIAVENVPSSRLILEADNA